MILKIIALIIMVLAFISNFAVPHILKGKREDITDSKINNIKLICAVVVVICALLVLLV